MLRIEKVFLQGFKSFCDPTEVVFDAEGITAVVGPNGCGKSNLSEAISWVIGEQRARALRGGKMEDVIFQGTVNRPASGMAEVLLTMVVRESFEVRPDATDVPIPEEPALTIVEPESATEPEPEPAKRRRKAPEIAARVYQEGEQITVGRRLYRTGESEYEMNGRTCRLRDVQDLFAGTGLGGAHYAIIEQGRIGQVLSAKPLDRRALIEEAAGVSKFKMRQHSAELKLEASRQNLSRLTDIILEIERQQNSLKRQAQRARRYQRLRGEMRDLMRAVYVADYRATNASLAHLEENWEAVSARESSSQGSITELEGQETEAAIAARDAETQLNSTREASAQINLETERARQQLSHFGEQLQTAENRAQQYARDREAVIERRGLVEREENRLREDLSSLEEAMQDAHRTLTADEESHRASLATDTEAEARLEAARANLYQTTTHLERWRQLHRQFGDAVERAGQRVDGLRAEEERTRSQAVANESEQNRLREQLTDADTRQAETSSRLDETVLKVSRLREARVQQGETHANIQRDLTATEHRLKSLAEFDQRHAYFSDAVQMLLEAASTEGTRTFTTLGTLADHINAAPDDEHFIEAVLRNELEYVLVPSFDDAFAAIDLLKRQGSGRATFVVTGLHGSEHPTPIINSDFSDADPPRREEHSFNQQEGIDLAAGRTDEPSEASEGEPSAPSVGFSSTLLPLLGLRPEIADTFTQAFPLLASAPVVESCEIAMECLLAANGGAASSLFLTRTGERLVGGRIVSGGSATEKGTGVLALRREISELRAKLEEQQQSAGEAESQLRSIDEQIGRHEAERVSLDTTLRSIEKELAVLREQAQQAERESDRIQMHLRVIGQDSENFCKELAEYREKLTQAEAETNNAIESHRSVELEVSSTQDEVAGLRLRAETRSQEIARQRAEYAATNERRRGLNNDITRLGNESHDLENRLQRSQLESVEAEAAIRSLDENISATRETATELSAQLDGINRELAERTLKLTELRNGLESLDQAVRAARESFALAREERAQLELDRVRLRSALDHIAESCQHELNEKITEILERLEKAAEKDGTEQTAPLEARPVIAESEGEDGDIELDGAADADDDISFWRVPENFDLAEAKVRLDELRTKIDALGPINMMALEELNEVEERFVFLSTQKADIEKAVSDTQAAIAEIRRRSRERFQEAFAAINANFSVSFQELFGGGRGEMRLIDENDILESGIEIIAQPPGKRLQNVLLLSGGEKAMAAIALVLAIFKYRPSPFCILDEVDAPLDEVNIGRFADKVTEMSANTQFVIITHSKRTMEAARALYGVTMEDPGVSKLISVRLT
jgi:chromosome segregation protein